MSFYLRFIFVLFFSCSISANNLFFKYRYRYGRQCSGHSGGAGVVVPFYRQNALESPLNLFFLIIISIILILMILGLIKALLGYFVSKKIGEFGMGLLVDLPKPLDQYQEKDLRQHPVEYDVGGWPIHPVTKKRTVRVLSRKTEFCLNVVFFMAYPLALIFQLCTLCCCIRRYSTDDEEKGCFKKVNVIKFNEELKSKVGSPGKNVDMYKEKDGQEAKDTKYVINQMKISQSSLQRS